MALAAASSLFLCAVAPRISGAAIYASYVDVRSVLSALAEVLPPELRVEDQAALEVAWRRWAVRHDGEIRARLEQGDEDTIVNWLLFGTSFTSRPLAVMNSSSAPSNELVELVSGRIRDLIAALQSPGSDERRLFARSLLERKGYRFESTADLELVEGHLARDVARVAREASALAQDLVEVRRLSDATEQFAARSRLFRSRGLSLDTTMLPSFAIESSIRALQKRGLIAAGAIRDVAIIGPGLDFADKGAGYDFYPQQTLQPFAIIDSLARLGLANRDGDPVRVATLDLSPRVNDHLSHARDRALGGLPYVIQLPIDAGVRWERGVLQYWDSAGDRIGTTEQRSIERGVRVRTVRVSPNIVRQIEPHDLNVVVQRLDRRFDLIVATNVFVYYDVLDQALAFSNVEAMLRPGGFLLSNNALLELPGSGLRSVGYLSTRYSDRPDDGDHIVWYRRLPD